MKVISASILYLDLVNMTSGIKEFKDKLLLQVNAISQTVK